MARLILPERPRRRRVAQVGQRHVERVQHPRVRENFEYLDVAPVEDAILTLARWHDMVSAWDPRRVEAMRVPCQSEWVGIIRQIKARLRI